MTWHDHINKIAKNTSQVINLLKRIWHLIPRSSLEMSYKYLILPIIEYGNTIYYNLTTYFSDKLENVQEGAALLCTGAFRHTSCEHLLNELGWEKLQTRWMYQRLSLMQTAERTDYKLRNSDNLTIPYCRTECFCCLLPPKQLMTGNNNLKLMLFKNKPNESFQFGKPVINKCHIRMCLAWAN